jgi:hypothetical protein
MYSASADFLTKIKSNTRDITWNGTITTTGGAVYTFDDENIINSGSITRMISQQSLRVGTVYAASLSIELILPGVSRYELYNGTIELECSIDGALDVIPMGSYTIGEALQASDHITLKAYDNMLLFDGVGFVPASHVDIQTPYNWLVEACTACGVVFGGTSAEVSVLPNGGRKTGFADVVSDVKTWRDVLGYLTAYLGGFAYIGRDGKLYVGSYKGVSDDTVPASFRYSSDLSDYRTTYDGLYAVYKEGGVQEYVSNSNVGGLVLDLGTNPFLQFTDSTNRLDALQEIIDSWNGIYYVPFMADMPLVPTYDPGDVLTFTDNQASVYDIGAICEITYNIGGQMHVTCSGDNPILASAQDRFSKTVAGLSSDYNNGQEIGGKGFWMLHTENTSALSVGSTKTQVAEIEFQQAVDVQKIGLVFTCEASLSATAVVDILITVDDSEDYEFEYTSEKTLKGKRPFARTCAFRVTGKGTHTAKVYMTVTDNALKWSDLV